MKQKPFSFLLITCAAILSVSARAELPPLPPFPEIPALQPEDSVPMADSKDALETQLNLSIEPGPFQPTWESIEKNYPGTPAWLREAKFGIWVHFGPQASGLSGDWYARNLYKPGTLAYKNHLKNFGHPSESGYKDVLRLWNPDKLDPAKLVELYKDAGARFLLIQAVHHDQFDLWNSRYQPWNAVNMGPKRDLLGEWTKAIRASGMRFGVAFHHEYSWWWGQAAFAKDTTGPKAGVPYDGCLTLADGKGKWWEGYDPRLLYGINLREYQGVSKAADSPWSPPPAGLFQNHTAYANWYSTWWALRMMDVVHNYSPDFIYTDGTDKQPFSGAGTGTGLKADAMQRVIADYYNYTLKTRGKVDVFSVVKFRPKTNGTVNTTEGRLPNEIKTDQPWMADTPVGDWFYRPGLAYESKSMIRNLIEAISRDGGVALNIPQLPDGSLEDGAVKMLKEVGEWMKINGSAVYESHAWSVLGEGEKGIRKVPDGNLGRKQADFVFDQHDFRFTVGKDDALYAFCLTVPAPGTELRIKSLGSTENRLGHPVKNVSLLGSHDSLKWKQEADALVITCPSSLPFQTAITFKIE